MTPSHFSSTSGDAAAAWLCFCHSYCQHKTKGDLLSAVSHELFLRKEEQFSPLPFLYAPVLTCIPESMDKAPSGFPEVNRVASSAENKKPPSVSGLVTRFDLRILLFIPFSWHQSKGSDVQKRRAGCQEGQGWKNEAFLIRHTSYCSHCNTLLHAPTASRGIYCFPKSMKSMRIFQKTRMLISR